MSVELALCGFNNKQSCTLPTEGAIQLIEGETLDNATHEDSLFKRKSDTGWQQTWTYWGVPHY